MVFIGSTAMFAAPVVITEITTVEASQKMNDSAAKIQKVVNNIKTNFKYDTDFTRIVDFFYLRHMQTRLLVRDSIFPKLYVSNDPEYKKSYYTITTDFVVSQDSKFIDSYRDLITTFCNYSIKYKNTPACSSNTINSLFKTE